MFVKVIQNVSECILGISRKIYMYLLFLKRIRGTWEALFKKQDVQALWLWKLDNNDI